MNEALAGRQTNVQGPSSFELAHSLPAASVRHHLTVICWARPVMLRASCCCAIRDRKVGFGGTGDLRRCIAVPQKRWRVAQ
jgi:hypothetical protein